MSDYAEVKHIASKKGPLTNLPAHIGIVPLTEWYIDRLIVLPVMDGNKKVHGLYMRVPAVITVPAFTAGEAAARADEIQANTKIQAWGNGAKPWDSGDSKVNWQEVPAPSDLVLNLR